MHRASENKACSSGGGNGTTTNRDPSLCVLQENRACRNDWNLLSMLAMRACAFAICEPAHFDKQHVSRLAIMKRILAILPCMLITAPTSTPTGCTAELSRCFKGRCRPGRHADASIDSGLKAGHTFRMCSDTVSRLVVLHNLSCDMALQAGERNAGPVRAGRDLWPHAAAPSGMGHVGGLDCLVQECRSSAARWHQAACAAL